MTRDQEVTSRIMASIPSRNTKPELTLRRALHRRGLRYRLHLPFPGRPDIVFTRARVAVFVDGDYWHGNTWRLRGAESLDAYLSASANAEFWRVKITANMRRDHAVTAELESLGWTVIRAWESDIRHDVDRVATRIQTTVRAAALQAWTAS